MPFEHVEQQAAEEQFLRNCDEEQSEQPAGSEPERIRKGPVKMQKAHREPQQQRNGRVVEKLAKPDAQVGAARPEVESDAVQPAKDQVAIQRGIEKQQLR